MTDNKVTFASTNSYSQALYELGNESGSLNEIEDQANNILKLISVNTELKTTDLIPGHHKLTVKIKNIPGIKLEVDVDPINFS